MNRDKRQVVARIVEICSIEIHAGVVFATDQVRSKPIRDSEIHAGVRIVMPAFIGRSRADLAVDMNFVDPVTPN